MAGYTGGSIADFVAGMRRPTEEVLRQGTKRASSRMVDVVKANTPVQGFLKQIAYIDSQGRYQSIQHPGHLRDSITERKLLIYTDSRGNRVYESGAETEVSYAPYVEEGTGLWGPKRSKYIIRPKRPGGWLSWITQHGFTRRDGTFVQPGTRVFAKKVEHPGSPGNHMFKIGVLMVEAEFDEIMAPILRDWVTDCERGV